MGSTGGLGLGLGGGESEEGDAKPTSRFTTFVKAAAPEVKPPDTGEHLACGARVWQHES